MPMMLSHNFPNAHTLLPPRRQVRKSTLVVTSLIMTCTLLSFRHDLNAPLDLIRYEQRHRIPVETMHEILRHNKETHDSTMLDAIDGYYLFRVDDATDDSFNWDNVADQIDRSRALQKNSPPIDLATVFDGNVRMYGCMYDISSLATTITIESLSLNLSTKYGAKLGVKVYTKSGSFLNGYNDSRTWTKVNSQTLVSQGYGRPSSLAKVRFTPITIQQGMTQSFYIELNNSHLVLTKTKSALGVTKDNYLAVYTGMGINQRTTFNNPSSNNKQYLYNLHWNHMWNGIVHYRLDTPSFGTIAATATNTPSSTTTSTSGTGLVKSLRSTFLGDNGSVGIMFDVISKASPIMITSLDIHTQLESLNFDVEVYTKPGSFTSFESTPTRWGLIFSSTVKGMGRGKPTPLPSTRFRDVTIPSLDTQAFYITIKTRDFIYSNGNGVTGSLPIINNENDDLQITEGSGIGEYKFSQSMIFSPRVFNGILHYKLDMGKTDYIDDTGIKTSESEMIELRTTMKGGNGSYGSMFDCVSQETITIKGMQIHTQSSSIITVEVWTREGSHESHESTSSGWIKILEPSYIRGLGPGKQTPLPVANFQPVVIIAGSTQAFYVTLTTAALKYTNGKFGIGKTFADDGILAVKEGIGVASFGFGKSFYSPRNFNGSILYEIGNVNPYPEDIGTSAIKKCDHPKSSSSKKSSRNTGDPSEIIPGTSSDINTMYNGLNKSFGSMFEISVRKNLAITSMNIHVETTRIILIEIYTKSGSYIDFENKPLAWTKIVYINVQGKGRGQPTSIPIHAFSPVHITAGSIQSFYVTLSTPDLIYTNGNNESIRSACVVATHADLDIHAGIGVIEYPFGQTTDDRIFNGALKFSETKQLD